MMSRSLAWWGIGLGVLVALNGAYAYEFRLWPHPGNGTTYHLDPNTLSQTQRDTITAAVKSWDAGAGERIRGAAWTTTVATLSTNQTAQEGNLRDEMFFRSDAWFQSRGDGGVIAAMYDLNGDDDVVYNELYTWCDSAMASNPGCRGPAAPPGFPQGYSIGQVTVHEFGHVIGFKHEDEYIATMNTFYPAGGELGEFKWQPHEDEVAGLQVLKPDASTGFNVSVAEWNHGPGTDGASAEIMWEAVNGVPLMVYDKSSASWGGTAPRLANLVYSGTGSQNVYTEWRVSSDTTCSSADPLVGTRTPTMSTNTPYVVGPNAWNFTQVNPGSYYLCVEVDPNDVLNETEENDNKVRSRNAHVVVQN